MKPILSAYMSRCQLCEKTVEEGDPIVKVDDEWVHAQCAEDEGYEVER